MSHMCCVLCCRSCLWWCAASCATCCVLPPVLLWCAASCATSRAPVLPLVLPAVLHAASCAVPPPELLWCSCAVCAASSAASCAVCAASPGRWLMPAGRAKRAADGVWHLHRAGQVVQRGRALHPDAGNPESTSSDELFHPMQVGRMRSVQGGVSMQSVQGGVKAFHSTTVPMTPSARQRSLV